VRGAISDGRPYRNSQTAFDFEILYALWVTQKRDLLAKTLQYYR
jgi:hypothetical protein